METGYRYLWLRIGLICCTERFKFPISRQIIPDTINIRLLEYQTYASRFVTVQIAYDILLLLGEPDHHFCTKFRSNFLCSSINIFLTFYAKILSNIFLEKKDERKFCDTAIEISGLAVHIDWCKRRIKGSRKKEQSV